MGALPVPCEAREWISSNQLTQAPGDGSGAQAHRRASRVRERARSAVAAAGGHERRLRALAGHHCAAPCRRGASTRATKACGLWLRTATTDFGGHFDPKEVLLPPLTHIPIDAELNLLHLGTLYFCVKVIFDEVI